MAGGEPDDIELLLTPEDIQRKRKRRNIREREHGYRSEGGAAGTTYWLESSTSEELPPSYLSDHSLPSERARIAAKHRYIELQKSGRQEMEMTGSERTPLLSGKARESVLGGSMETSEPPLLRVEESLSGGDLSRELGKDLRGVSRTERKRERCLRVGRIFRVSILTLLLVTSMTLFSINKEPENKVQIVTTSDPSTTSLTFNHSHNWNHAIVTLNGPFEDKSFSGNGTGADCEEFVFLCSKHFNYTTICSKTDSHCQSVRVSDGGSASPPSFLSTNIITRHLLHPSPSNEDFQIQFSCDSDVSFQVSARGELLSDNMQVVVATCILVGVYFLIIFDIVHRTLAAFIGSTATIAALSMLDKRPTLDEVVEWIDLDTIFLLFGMMTLVAIFSQTGFFDYSAVKAYKLAKGKIGPLLTILCLLSAVVSAFLDNVTTILLLTPVSIRLCQVLNVDPLPVLIAEVVFSNIGGTATAVGDPPNVIIVSNKLINEKHGIGFGEFTLHLSLGIILCMGVAFALLACIYCTCVRLPNKDPPHIAELKREIAIWERTASRMPVVSLEETAVRGALREKAGEVKNQLQREVLLSVQSAQDTWQANLAQLERQYSITNPLLLAKSAAVLLVVILLFFLADVLPSIHLGLGWIAVFGAVVLLVLSDIQDLEPILHKIEWSTLLFFAGLFVLMEGLQELGLISFIGDEMVKLIKTVPQKDQMTVAIVLVVWVSALASSFIDNIPFTTATIPVIVELAESPEVCLSLRPLVWALAFGACLGGNGTLIGASANVVCAGIAEQNGYKISFLKFFSIGFPMMLATTFTAMIYLLISHVALEWDVDTTSCS